MNYTTTTSQEKGNEQKLTSRSMTNELKKMGFKGLEKMWYFKDDDGERNFKYSLNFKMSPTLSNDKDIHSLSLHIRVDASGDNIVWLVLEMNGAKKWYLTGGDSDNVSYQWTNKKDEIINFLYNVRLLNKRIYFNLDRFA